MPEPPDAHSVVKNCALYLDESEDHGVLNFSPEYPVLALRGVVADEPAYSKVILPRLDTFKVDQQGGVTWAPNALRTLLNPITSLKFPASKQKASGALRPSTPIAVLRSTCLITL